MACLEEATKYTPCDGRLYNNLGIALERFLEYHHSSCTTCDTGYIQSQLLLGLHDKILTAYRTSVTIHSLCERMGCDVGSDCERACLNYGLYLSKQNDFEGAVDVLSRIVTPAGIAANTTTPMSEHDVASCERQRVIEDATKLLAFCRKRISS